MRDINKIWKFLQRQLNSKEHQSLQKWKNNSEENLDLFSDIHGIWSASDHLEDIRLFDTEKGWAEIEDQIKERKSPAIKSIKWIGIAASLFLVAATVFWLTRSEEETIEEPIYQSYTAINQYEELQLPDNSVVYLEQGTSIKYFTRLDKSFEDRRVFLAGKATFDIVSNDTLPFIVEVTKTGVEVLGTIFKVEHRDSNDISVENIEGLIKFYELSNEANAVTIKEGEKFNFNGEVFVDKTVREEKQVIISIAKTYTIQELWYQLLLKFENKITIHSYGSHDPNATVIIDLDQPLKTIIKTLESNPSIQMNYKQTCPDCFEIETFMLTN